MNTVALWRFDVQFFVMSFECMRCVLKVSTAALLHICCILLVVGASGAQAASFSACSQQFYQQTPPRLVHDALKKQTYPLCFNGFAVMYSGVSRTPLWSAEYLTPARLKQAKALNRQGEFYEELRVPAAYRSQLSDYARSGYDRGHMAPNGDMGSRSQQADSFSLGNMVPQTPYNNQEVWRNLEEATRALVLKKRTSAYVLTGPAFLGQRVKRIGGKQGVLVPSHVYKVVYLPELNAASAYIAVNDSRAALRIMPVAQLEQLTGINLLPELSSSLKHQLVNLPVTAKQANKSTFDLWDAVSPQYTAALPMPDRAAVRNTDKQADKSEQAGQQSWWQLLLNKFLNWLIDMLISKGRQ